LANRENIKIDGGHTMYKLQSVSYGNQAHFICDILVSDTMGVNPGCEAVK
jgi:hypothetical protein